MKGKCVNLFFSSVCLLTLLGCGKGKVESENAQIKVAIGLRQGAEFCDERAEVDPGDQERAPLNNSYAKIECCKEETTDANANRS